MKEGLQKVFDWIGEYNFNYIKIDAVSVMMKQLVLPIVDMTEKQPWPQEQHNLEKILKTLNLAINFIVIFGFILLHALLKRPCSIEILQTNFRRSECAQWSIQQSQKRNLSSCAGHDIGEIFNESALFWIKHWWK